MVLQSGVISGCYRKTGRRTRIGMPFRAADSSSGGGGITRYRATGRFVAVVDVSTDATARFASIRSVNLRTGRAVQSWGAGGQSNASIDADITDLVVSDRGSIAFVEGFGGPAAERRPTRFVVRRNQDDDGQSTVLDSGGDIAPDSLKLAGDRLSWKRSGLLKTAALS